MATHKRTTKREGRPRKGLERKGVERTFRLVEALLRGEELDRGAAAAVMDVEKAEAYDRLRLAEQHLSGVQSRPSSSGTLFRLAGFRYHAASYQEAIAAAFSASLATLFEGTALGTAAASAVQHVVEAAQDAPPFANLKRKFFFVRRGGENALPERGRDLEHLATAVIEQRYVRLTYRNFGGIVEPAHKIRPLSLAVYDHQLYLVAWRQDDEVRAYRFSRIVRARVLSSTFEYPSRSEYDPDVLFDQVIGVFIRETRPVQEVRVRLHRRYLVHAQSHRWHRTQRISQRGQAVIVQLYVRPCPELEQWILSFGDEAEVLEPKWLRKKIGSRLRRAAEKYS